MTTLLKWDCYNTGEKRIDLGVTFTLNYVCACVHPSYFAFRDVVHFDRRAICPAADEDCIPVTRLHVYVTNEGKSLLEGWVSVEGRLREAPETIFEVRQKIYQMIWTYVLLYIISPLFKQRS